MARKKRRRSISFWDHGELSRLADFAGLSPQYLSDIIRRRRNVSVGKAMVLEKACLAATGKEISWTVWATNKTTDHPAFK